MFYARQGYIGNKNQGWKVEPTKMYNGASSFGAAGGFFLSPTQGISLAAPENGTSSDELIPSD